MTSPLLAAVQGNPPSDTLDEARTALKARQYVSAKYATLRVIKALGKDDVEGRAEANTLLAEILFDADEPTKEVIRCGQIALSAARLSLREKLIGQACLILGRAFLHREKKSKAGGALFDRSGDLPGVR